jgi:hypothetical protein
MKSHSLTPIFWCATANRLSINRAFMVVNLLTPAFIKPSTLCTGQNSDDGQLIELSSISPYCTAVCRSSYLRTSRLLLQILIKDAGSAAQLSPLFYTTFPIRFNRIADEPVISHAGQVDLLSVVQNTALMLPSTKPQPTMKPAIGWSVCALLYRGRNNP